MDSENRATGDSKSDPSQWRIDREGNPETLTSTQFVPYGPTGGEPNKFSTYGRYMTVPDKLRHGLRDPQRQFLLSATIGPGEADPLPEIVAGWIGGQSPISVLDFSGVPGEVTEIAVGAILDLILQVAVNTPDEGPGVGRTHPVLVVLEEAHRYIGKGGSLAAKSADRIAREGRKHGVGLMMVTQRPSELPATALAQCGTIIALRLTNAEDQQRVQASLPDSLQGIGSALGSLRTGEAIVSGEALTIPTRVVVDRPSPFPRAEDPSLDSWHNSPSKPDLTNAIAQWRSIYGGTS